MSSRHHIDDFMRGRIIGKIEEGRKITDVVREFDIAHSVVSRLWKSFKLLECVVDGTGEVVLEVRRLQKTDISSYQQKGTGAPQLSRRQLIWRESGTAYRPENIQEKDRYPTCSIMVWAGIMINGRTRLHVVANGTMTGQRYIDEVLLPHVRLFRGAVDALERQVAGRNYPPTNKNTLIRALTEEWDKLPQQLLDNVVQKKLTVWCALWAGGIIGPYFFKNDEGHNVTVNGDRYRAMITNFFIPELNNHDVQELWFQQNGATCHTACATIDLLKDTFGDCLISRFGPVNWPPRSCDLTPLDYFLWGYVKSLVYADKPQTLDHLEDNIRRVIADIRPQMLEKVIENWTSRLDYIRGSRGSPMPEIIFKM
ncbi:uncharacterized protein TNCV_4705561 [Trichonephila clavipes]|nr:uncharacterized protein TNCV_4705561 [Trichonephila clavipes]